MSLPCFGALCPASRTIACLLALIGTLIGVLSASGARADVQLVTSLRPLALIGEAVVGEDGRVEHLLPASASPHDYPLKVSDMRRLTSADLMLWVGPELETSLRRPVGNLPDRQQLTLVELDSMHWPEESGHDHHDEGAHDHGDRDPHLWLDPRNGAVIARALAERLAEKDPDAAEAYRSRAEALALELEALDERLAERLAPVRTLPFVVYHEGYAHFVERYRLHQSGAVTLSPERRPGARHLHELRHTLQDARCLFIEPYYDMESARDLAGEAGLRLGELDLLGADQSIDGYPALLEALAGDVIRCLEDDGTDG